MVSIYMSYNYSTIAVLWPSTRTIISFTKDTAQGWPDWEVVDCRMSKE